MSYLDEHRSEIFKKYDKEALIKDYVSFRDGKGKLNKFLNHFFEELIYESHGSRGKVPPIEALQDDEIMNKILAYVKTKPKFYVGNEISNVKSFFRNAHRTSSKVSNFDPKNARMIYQKYQNGNQHLNILDTSAGFGARLSGALAINANYCGIDPNIKLIKQLQKCGDFLKENALTGGEYRFFCQGSETFIPELENSFDLSFTSPPYFNLEYYCDDKCASTSNYDNYNAWLEEFAKPTIVNTYKYLKIGGIAAINIKNLTTSGREPLYDDWFGIFSSIAGFKFLETIEMSVQSKRNYAMNTNYSLEAYKGFKEPIMVFQKIQ